MAENRYISGNLEFDRYQATSSRDRVEEDGDDSDTATDILLAQDTGTPQGRLARHPDLVLRISSQFL